MDGLRDAEMVTSLRDKVVRRVRSDIVSGRSAPGTMYSVPTLAEQLGVSTTPVREALLELSRGGLITPLRNRGFRVEGPRCKNSTICSPARAAGALRHGHPRRAADQLEVGELKALADDIAAAVKNMDVLAYVEADRAFHQALIAKADNPLLTRLTMDLRDGMRLYGIDSAAGRQRQEASVKEHYELIDLAIAGNVKSIANLISHHILDWKPVFTAALSDRFGSEPK